jgi:hypothetical protein
MAWGAENLNWDNHLAEIGPQILGDRKVDGDQREKRPWWNTTVWETRQRDPVEALCSS